uniref:Uncharacterized protein n=1 Tax=Globodera rostochiensis TaxID=31243 RepID=A0A914GQA9_GLORO
MSVEISTEELERQRSLVVMGLPESTDPLPSKRAAADKAQVSGLLDSLGIECGPSIVYRLGRSFNPTQKSARLLKVLLPARAFQRQALTAWRTKNNTIRSSASQLKNIQIRESLTREQLEERRRLHALCTGKRTKDGQDWIVYAGSVILRSEVHIFRQQMQTQSIPPSTPNTLSSKN